MDRVRPCPAWWLRGRSEAGVALRTRRPSGLTAAPNVLLTVADTRCLYVTMEAMAHSVYEPLRRWLASCDRSRVNLSFSEIEQILGRKLPPSAYQYDVWWNNEDDPSSTHTQSKYGWMAAGYSVSSLDRAFPCVTFSRSET